MAFAVMAPRMQPDDLDWDVGERVTPADTAEAGVGEQDDRVEMSAGDGAEHEDDREQAGGGSGGVLEELQGRHRWERASAPRCPSR